MLTAGHCITELGMSSGDNVYHNTTQIGTYSGIYQDGAASSSGTGIDAAVLYMNGRWTAYDDVIDSGSYRDITGATSTYVAGYLRCWTGKNSGTQCGAINCTSITYQYGPTGRWYTDMFTIDPGAVAGDSGAPAYKQESNLKAKVTGIARSNATGGSCMTGFDTAFSKWFRIRDYWGLTLVTDG